MKFQISFAPPFIQKLPLTLIMLKSKVPCAMSFRRKQVGVQNLKLHILTAQIIYASIVEVAIDSARSEEYFALESSSFESIQFSRGLVLKEWINILTFLIVQINIKSVLFKSYFIFHILFFVILLA